MEGKAPTPATQAVATVPAALQCAAAAAGPIDSSADMLAMAGMANDSSAVAEESVEYQLAVARLGIAGSV